MAASTAAFVGVGSSTTLSACNTFATTSSLNLTASPRSVAAGVPRVAAVRASLPEKEQEQDRVTTRRDVLANLLGAGAAMGIAGQALAANPGTLPRSLNTRKEEKKPEAEAKAKE